MSAEWKPGDVAMVQISSAHGPEIAVSSDLQWFVAGPRLGSQHGWYHDRVTVIRPLVVIDPEDREQVERLRKELHRIRSLATDNLQAALREFANPTPPKPDEPMGLGAVVEDESGERYVRHGSADLDDSVTWCNSVGVGRSWSRINAVRILSEGISDD